MDVEEHQKLLISKLQDLVRKKDEEVIEKEKALKEAESKLNKARLQIKSKDAKLNALLKEKGKSANESDNKQSNNDQVGRAKLLLQQKRINEKEERITKQQKALKEQEERFTRMEKEFHFKHTELSKKLNDVSVNQGIDVDSLENHKSKLEMHLTNCEEQLEAITRRNASLEAQLTVSEERLAEVQRENEQLLNEVQSNEHTFSWDNFGQFDSMPSDFGNINHHHAEAVQYLQSQLEELANEHELQIQEHEKITARLNESINRLSEEKQHLLEAFEEQSENLNDVLKRYEERDIEWNKLTKLVENQNQSLVAAQASQENFTVYADKSTKNLQQLESKYSSLQGKYKEKMEELLVINDEKEKYENELPELRKKITCLEKENDFLTEQVRKNNDMIEAMQKEIDHTTEISESNNQKHVEELKKLKQLLLKKDEEMLTVTADLKDSQDQCDTLRQLMVENNAKYEQLQEGLSGFQIKVETLQSDLASKEALIEAANLDSGNKSREILRLKDDYALVSEQLQKSNEDLKDIKKDETDDLRNLLDEKEKFVTEIQRKLKASLVSRKSLMTKVKEIECKKTELESLQASLKEEKADLLIQLSESLKTSALCEELQAKHDALNEEMLQLRIVNETKEESLSEIHLVASKLEQQLVDAKEENSNLLTVVDTLEKRNQNLSQTIDELTTTNNEFMEQLQGNANETTAVKEQLHLANEKASKLEEALHNNQEETDVMVKEIEKFKEFLSIAVEKKLAAENEKANIQDELQLANEKAEQLTKQLADLQEAHNHGSVAASTLQAEVSGLKNQLDSTKSENKNASLTAQMREEEISKLESRIGSLNDALLQRNEELKETFSLLEAEKKTANASLIQAEEARMLVNELQKQILDLTSTNSLSNEASDALALLNKKELECKRLFETVQAIEEKLVTADAERKILETNLTSQLETIHELNQEKLGNTAEIETLKCDLASKEALIEAARVESENKSQEILRLNDAHVLISEQRQKSNECLQGVNKDETDELKNMLDEKEKLLAEVQRKLKASLVSRKSLVTKVKELESEKTKLETSQASLEQEKADILIQLSESLNASALCEDFREKYDSLNEEMLQLRSAIEAKEESMSETRLISANFEQQLADVRAENSKLSEVIDELEKKNQDLFQSVKDLTSINNRYTEQLQAYAIEKSNADLELQKVSNELSDLNNFFAESQKELSIKSQETEKLKELLSVAGDKKEAAENEIAVMQNELQSMNERASQLTKQLGEYNKTQSELLSLHSEATSTLQEQMSDLKNQLDLAKDEIKNITREADLKDEENSSLERKISDFEKEFMQQNDKLEDSLSLLEVERKASNALHAQAEETKAINDEFKKQMLELSTIASEKDSVIDGLQKQVSELSVIAGEKDLIVDELKKEILDLSSAAKENNIKVLSEFEAKVKDCEKRLDSSKQVASETLSRLNEKELECKKLFESAQVAEEKLVAADSEREMLNSKLGLQMDEIHELNQAKFENRAQIEALKSDLASKEALIEAANLELESRSQEILRLKDADAPPPVSESLQKSNTDLRDGEKDENVELRNMLGEKEKLLAEVQKKLKAALVSRKSLIANVKELKAEKSELEVLRSSLEEEKVNLSMQLSESLNASQNEASEALALLNERELECKKLSECVEEVKEKLVFADSERNILETKLASQLDEIHALTQEKLQNAAEIDTLKSDLSSKETLIEAANDDLENKSQEILRLENAHAIVSEQLQKSNEELKDVNKNEAEELRKMVAEQEKHLSDMQKKLKAALVSRKSLMAKVKEFESEKVEWETRFTLLTEEKANLSAQLSESLDTSQNEASEALTLLKEKEFECKQLFESVQLYEEKIVAAESERKITETKLAAQLEKMHALNQETNESTAEIDALKSDLVSKEALIEAANIDLENKSQEILRLKDAHALVSEQLQKSNEDFQDINQDKTKELSSLLEEKDKVLSEVHKKLKAALTSRKSLMAKVKELESEKGELEALYTSLENEKANLSMRLDESLNTSTLCEDIQAKYDALNKEMSQLRLDNEAKGKSLSEILLGSSKLEQQLVDIKEENSNLSDVINNLERKNQLNLQHADEEISKMNEMLLENRSEIKLKLQEIEKLKEYLLDAKKSKLDVENEKKSIENELLFMSEKVDQLKKQVSELEEIHSELTSHGSKSTSTLEHEISELKNQLDTAKLEIEGFVLSSASESQSMANQCSSKDAEIKNLEKEIENLVSCNSDLSKKVSYFENLVAGHEEEVSRLSQEKISLLDQNAIQEKTVEEQRENSQVLQATINNLKDEITFLAQSHTVQVEQLNMLIADLKEKLTKSSNMIQQDQLQQAATSNEKLNQLQRKLKAALLSRKELIAETKSKDQLIQEKTMLHEKCLSEIKILQDAMQNKLEESTLLGEDLIKLKSLLEKKEAAIKDVMDEYEQSKVLNQTLQEQKLSLENKIDELLLEVKTLQTCNTDMNEMVSAIEARSTKLEKTIAERTDALRSAQKCIRKLENTLGQGEVGIKEAEEMKKKFKLLEEKCDHLSENCDQLEAEKREKVKMLEQVTGDFEKEVVAKEDLLARFNEMERLLQTRESTEHDLLSSEDFAKLKVDPDKLLKNLAELKGKCSDLETCNNKLLREKEKLLEQTKKQALDLENLSTKVLDPNSDLNLKAQEMVEIRGDNKNGVKSRLERESLLRVPPSDTANDDAAEKLNFELEKVQNDLNAATRENENMCKSLEKEKEIQEKLQNKIDQLQSVQKEYDLLKKKHEALQRDSDYLNSALQTEKEQNDLMLKKVDRENSILRQKIDASNKEVTQLGQLLQDSNKNCASLTQQCSELQTTVIQVRSSMDSSLSNNNAIQASFDQYKAETTQHLNDIKTALHETEEKLAVAENQATELSNDNQLLQVKLSESGAELAIFARNSSSETEDLNKKLQQLSEDKEQAVTDLHATVARLEEELASERKEIDVLFTANNKLREEGSALKSSFELTENLLRKKEQEHLSFVSKVEAEALQGASNDELFKSEKENLQVELKKRQSLISDLVSDCMRLKNELSAAKSESEKDKEDVASLSLQTKSLLALKAQYETNENHLKSELADKDRVIHRQQEEVDAFRNKNRTLLEEFGVTSAKDLQMLLTTYVNEIKALKSELHRKIEDIKALRVNEEELLEEKDSLLRDIEDLRFDFDNLQQELAASQQELEDMQRKKSTTDDNYYQLEEVLSDSRKRWEMEKTKFILEIDKQMDAKNETEKVLQHLQLQLNECNQNFSESADEVDRLQDLLKEKQIKIEQEEALMMPIKEKIANLKDQFVKEDSIFKEMLDVSQPPVVVEAHQQFADDNAVNNDELLTFIQYQMDQLGKVLRHNLSSNVSIEQVRALEQEISVSREKVNQQALQLQDVTQKHEQLQSQLIHATNSCRQYQSHYNNLRVEYTKLNEEMQRKGDGDKNNFVQKPSDSSHADSATQVQLEELQFRLTELNSERQSLSDQVLQLEARVRAEQEHNKQIESQWKAEVAALSLRSSSTTVNIEGVKEDAVLLKPTSLTRKAKRFTSFGSQWIKSRSLGRRIRPNIYRILAAVYFIILHAFTIRCVLEL